MRAANISSYTQRQWYSRPDDEKFGSVESILTAVTDRKARTKTIDTDLDAIEFMPDGEDGRGLVVTTKKGLRATPTHWAFGQTCAMVGAHASYLRDLPTDLAAKCLNWGVKTRAEENNRGLGLMIVDPKNADAWCEVHAVNSQRYGRIWDASVAQTAYEIVGASDGRFFSPLDWTKEKRALFASDRDIHMLFIDGGSIVDGGSERDQLNRGWIIGNSEVGASAFYMATFLFRVVCGNFAIHGLEDVNFTRIRHTINAPSKFINEAIPVLNRYVNGSPKPLEQIIRKAKEFMLPKNITEHMSFFRSRGFTAAETQVARLMAVKEEGDADTLWNMINGFTASARRIKHMDAKVNLETRAGKLLLLAA